MSDLLDWTFRGNRSGRKVSLKGFTIKDGKVVRDPKRLNVVQRLQQRNSARVRFKRGK
jgi:hypothetical protein